MGGGVVEKGLAGQVRRTIPKNDMCTRANATGEHLSESKRIESRLVVYVRRVNYWKKKKNFCFKSFDRPYYTGTWSTLQYLFLSVYISRVVVSSRLSAGPRRYRPPRRPRVSLTIVTVSVNFLVVFRLHASPAKLFAPRAAKRASDNYGPRTPLILLKVHDYRRLDG